MRITIYATTTGGAWSSRSSIWDSNYDGEPSFYGGKLSLDIEKAGTLEFTVAPNHPYYASFVKMKTILTVCCDDNTTLFRGRVSSVEVDVFKQKKITAEETLAYLNDSVYLPSGKDITSTPRARLTAAINNHNSQMGSDSEKKFTVGTVSNSRDIDTSRTYNDTSYSDTMGYLKEELSDQYGGFFRVRYNSDYTTKYLDWIESYGSTASQVVQFGQNIIELTREDISDDLFTVLVPYGNDNLTLSGSSSFNVNVTKQDGTKQTIQVNQNGKYLEIPSGISAYGKIYKSESFSEDTASAVLNEAKYYISGNYHPNLLSFKIQVIDWRYIDETIPRIKLGDKATIVYDSAGSSEQLICTAVDYDLMEPESTEFTFGVPDQTLSRKNDKDRKASKKRSTRTASSLWRTDGKTKTIQSDIVRIIGDEYVEISGGHIDIKTDTFTIANTLGDAILDIEDDVVSIKDLMADHIYVDQGDAFTIRAELLYMNNDAHFVDAYVASDLLIGYGADGATSGATVVYGNGGTNNLVIDPYGLQLINGFPLSVSGTSGTIFSVNQNGISIYNTNDTTPSMQDLLDHRHQITATELTGANAGKVKLELGEVTYDSSKYIDTFDIASTRYYQSAMADAVIKQTVADIQYVTESLAAVWSSSNHTYAFSVGAKAMYDTNNVDEMGEPILAPMLGTNPDTFIISSFAPTDAINYGKTLVGFASTVFTYNTLDPSMTDLPDSRTIYANLNDGRKSSGSALYMYQDGDKMYLRSGGNSASNNIAVKSISMPATVNFASPVFTYNTLDPDADLSASRTIYANLTDGRKSTGTTLYLAQDGDYMYLRAGSNSSDNNIAKQSVSSSVAFSEFTFSGNTHIVTTRTMYANLDDGRSKAIENKLLLDYNSNTNDGWFGNAPYSKYVFWQTAPAGTTSWSSRMRGTISGEWVYNKGVEYGSEHASPSISIDRGTRTGINSGPSPTNAVQIWSGSGSLPTSVTSNGFYSFKVTAGGSTKWYYFLVNV